MKRWGLWILLLVLVCGVSGASARDVYYAQGTLPECYQYLVEGAAFAYHSEAFQALAEPVPGSPSVGTLRPGQHVHVEMVDRNNGWAYLFFYENDSQQGWNFEPGCLKGWVNQSRVVNWDAVPSYTVQNPKAGDRLNLRSKPSVGAITLGKYYSGAVALALQAPSKGYVKVRIGHMEGYMDTKYLTPGLTCPAPELPRLTVNGSASKGMEMRKLPQKNSQVIKTVPQGAAVTALGVRDDAWVQVMCEAEIGYAKAEQMNPRLDYHKGTGSSASRQGLMVSNPNPYDRLNLREGPSQKDKSLGRFYSGTPVTVDKTSGGWSYVTIGAQSGWMDSGFLKSPDQTQYAAVSVQTLANVTFTQLPTYQSTSMMGFPAGFVIEIYGDLEGGWHYARSGDVWGYIHEDGIQRDMSNDLSQGNGAGGL